MNQHKKNDNDLTGVFGNVTRRKGPVGSIDSVAGSCRVYAANNKDIAYFDTTAKQKTTVVLFVCCYYFFSSNNKTVP